MHIINLTVKCKTATGDGTKIVCMNSDYAVRITAEDCGTFTEAPVKKLVIRHDREYQEVDIVEVVEYGRTYLQAVLPPISRMDFVDVGVCGKQTDDPDAVPIYASTSARYTCDKSILCGTVVKLSGPTLTDIEITENGTYNAGDYAADGFSEVAVKVAGGDTEKVAVDLSMSNGDQIILPSKTGLAMSEVVIYKPTALTPENIVKGITIGGVEGTHETILDETRIFDDGEYTPPTGVNGFSKVIVSVAKSSREKTMRVGQSFTYNYNTSATVEMSTSGIVQYADSGASVTITAKAIGTCMVTVKDYDASGKLVNTVYYDVEVTTAGDATMPVEVSNASDMDKYLTRGVSGAVLKYVGNTTDKYTKNSYYLIEEV